MGTEWFQLGFLKLHSDYHDDISRLAESKTMPRHIFWDEELNAIEFLQVDRSPGNLLNTLRDIFPSSTGLSIETTSDPYSKPVYACQFLSNGREYLYEMEWPADYHNSIEAAIGQLSLHVSIENPSLLKPIDNLEKYNPESIFILWVTAYPGSDDKYRSVIKEILKLTIDSGGLDKLNRTQFSNTNGWTAISHAVKGAKMELIDRFIEACASLEEAKMLIMKMDVNENTFTPIIPVIAPNSDNKYQLYEGPEFSEKDFIKEEEFWKKQNNPL